MVIVCMWRHSWVKFSSTYMSYTTFDKAEFSRVTLQPGWSKAWHVLAFFMCVGHILFSIFVLFFGSCSRSQYWFYVVVVSTQELAYFLFALFSLGFRTEEKYWRCLSGRFAGTRVWWSWWTQNYVRHSLMCFTNMLLTFLMQEHLSIANLQWLSSWRWLSLFKRASILPRSMTRGLYLSWTMYCR